MRTPLAPSTIDEAFEQWYRRSGQSDQFEDARAGWREAVEWMQQNHMPKPFSLGTVGGGLNSITFNEPDIPHKNPLSSGYTADEVRELLKDDVAFMIERTEHFMEESYKTGYKCNDAGMSFKLGGLLALTSKFKQSLKEVFRV